MRLCWRWLLRLELFFHAPGDGGLARPGPGSVMFYCRTHPRIDRNHCYDRCRDCALWIFLDKVRYRLNRGEKENDITLDELKRYKKAKHHPRFLVELGKLKHCDTDTSSSDSSDSSSFSDS